MSAHLIELGDFLLAVQFAKESHADLAAYAEKADALAGGALRGAASILRADKAEEGGQPQGAMEAVEAAEFLRSLAQALRESARNAVAV